MSQTNIKRTNSFITEYVYFAHCDYIDHKDESNTFKCKLLLRN